MKLGRPITVASLKVVPCVVAFTGLAMPAAGAWPEFTLHMHADATTVSVGDTITWTVSVTGQFGSYDYVSAYDLNFLATDETLGIASVFEDNLNPIIHYSYGPSTPRGASVLGAVGGQSSIIGTPEFGDVVLGAFSVAALAPGTLTYAVEDGGVLGTVDHLRVPPGGFGPDLLNGPATYLDFDTVTIVPAPTGVLAFAPLALVARRRRR